jgi:hypothetical protein
MDAAKNEMTAATLTSNVLASHEERLWALERLVAELVRSHNDVVQTLSGILNGSSEHKGATPASPVFTASVASGPTITYTIAQLKQMRNEIRALNSINNNTSASSSLTSAGVTNNAIPRKSRRPGSNSTTNSNNYPYTNGNANTNNISRRAPSKRSPLPSPTPSLSASVRQHRQPRDMRTARTAEPEVLMAHVIHVYVFTEASERCILTTH